MKITIAIASAALVLSAGTALAQRGGDTIPMRDGSTVVTVSGGCIVQYGARGQRINNANRCNDDDMRRADQIMSGGGGYGGGYGGGFGGNGGAAPYGSWAQSCRGLGMRGSVFQAECRTEDGRMNQTVLDMRNCPSNNAENRNGSLVCR
jgi:hypothetical protein